MEVSGGTPWHSWLRHCTTSRKVAGLIPDGVIGTFHWHNPSGRTMALGLTQPLTEMSIYILGGGKGGRCVGLTTLPSSCADCLEIWEPQPPGTLWVCPGLYWDCFTFTYTWRWVVCFITLVISSPGQYPCNLMNGRLGGPQSCLVHTEGNLLVLARNQMINSWLLSL
jgi:hypothetical protein